MYICDINMHVCVSKLSILIFWILYAFSVLLTLVIPHLLYLMLYILSTYSVLTPFLRGLRFMPAGTDAQLGDPPV